ncbi:hypothetical protein RI054_06g35280 [Pseudoscourfieldia marina]
MRVSETLLAGQRGFLLGDHRWTAHKLGQPWFRAGQAFAYGDAIPAFVSTLTKPPTTSRQLRAGEGEEKEEEKIPTPLPSPVSVEVLAGRLAAPSRINTAEKIKELEPSLLRERDARREAEVQLMQKQLAEATSEGSDSVDDGRTAKTVLGARCQRHQPAHQAYPFGRERLGGPLSRRRDNGDWRLSRAEFLELDRRYGPHNYDRFATTLNRQVQRFDAAFHMPEVSAIDTLTQDWSQHNNYANPPWDLMPQVAQKINESQHLRMTLIVPYWNSHLAFQQLLQRAGEITILPSRRELFTRHHRAFGTTSPPGWDVAVLRRTSSSPAPPRRTRKAKVKYTLKESAPQGPWAAAVHTRIGIDYGDTAQTADIQQLVTGSLAERSIESYGGKFDKFPYFSAINTVHAQCGLPQPALSDDLRLVRNGWEQQQQLADPTNLPLQRVPIPPDVMKSVLHCGLAAAAQPSLDLQLLRDCACLVTSYLFFNRSDTAFQLQRCGPDAMLPDLRIDEERQQLNFVERNFKGKSKKLTKRLLTIDCADKLDCLQLLRAFTRATSHLRCQYFWQLPSDTGRWLATSIDDMLQRVLKRLAPRHQPPPGCKWTSHSLRAGAASAAYAVCKDFLKLCLYGGWARGSDVMQDAYIDPSWRSTDAARYFFGWLRDAAG